MHTKKQPRLAISFAKALSSLVLALPLIVVSPVEASISAVEMRTIHRQTNPNTVPSSIAQFNLPPVAVNDSGPGFNTFRHKSFTTGSVLANDYDPDGDLLFVNSFDESGLKGTINYLAGGSLDTTFGSDGKVTTDLGGFYYSGPVIVQPDKKILVAGYTTISSSQGDTYGFVLARYNSNGSLDTSFNTTGVVTTTFAGEALEVNAIVIQPDDKIVVTGVVNTAPHSNYGLFGLVRYNQDGSLDATFGSGGKVTTDLGGIGAISRALTLQPDGKFVAAGWVDIGTYGHDYFIFAAARYNPDGNLDATFGSGGKVTIDLGKNAGVESVVLQSDGKIVVAGFSGIWPASDFTVARFIQDGSLDKSLNGTGFLTTKFNGDAWGETVAIQPDGKIVVGGVIKPDGHSSLYYVFGLARFNPDGSLDTHFNGTGMVTTDLGYSAVGQSLALQPDGKLILAGNTWTGSVYDYALVRYNPDGSLDNSFNGNGIITTAFGNAYYRASAALQSDGKIVLAGSANHTFVLARYNSGGTFSYDPNGKFDNLAPGEQAADVFTYTASDGFLTDTATVTITVTGANQVYLPAIR